MKNYRKLKRIPFSLLRGILISGLCFMIVYPLLLKISSSLMSLNDLYDPTVFWIPRNISFENIYLAFEIMDYPVSVFYSFLLALTVSLAQLASCTFVGYGFARYDFWGKKIWFALVIFVLLVPPQLIMIPLFLNFRFFNLFGLLGQKGINLLGSFWPFIFISITAVGLRNGLYIYIMRQFFRGMASELEEAARVDGAGPLKTFLKIMLPHAFPAMLIVFIFSFVWQWNDLFYTNLFLDDSPLLPFELSNLGENFRLFYGGYLAANERISLVNDAGMLLFTAPLLILYGFLQRYFIKSIERTGLVG